MYEFFASEWIFKLKPGSGRVALTFDDGPNKQTTPLLLKTLEELDIQATFFLTGENCLNNQCVLEQASQADHILANHGYFHKRHFFYGNEQQKKSVESTGEILSSFKIKYSPLFRPPYGSFNFQTSKILKSSGYNGVLWSVMIKDWKQQSQKQLWNNLKNKLHDGAIIVLHDGQETTPAMLSVLPYLADEIRQRNWNFVTLTPETLS